MIIFDRLKRSNSKIQWRTSVLIISTLGLLSKKCHWCASSHLHSSLNPIAVYLPRGAFTTRRSSSPKLQLVHLLFLQGGAQISIDADDEKSEDEDDVVSSKDNNKHNDADYDTEEYEDYEEEEEEDSDQEETTTSGTSKSQISQEVAYDAPFLISPQTSFLIQIGLLILCRRVDMKDSKIINIARFSFIGYIIFVNLFTLYVKFVAKRIDDSSVITLENPMMKLVKSQLNNAVSSDLASSLLTNSFTSGTKITIRDYDVQQANTLFYGLLPNLIIMWIIHFKFKQVQPLFLTTASGLLTLIQSPLFQVYIFGKNLERPFKSPTGLLAEKMLTNNQSETSASENLEEVDKVVDDISNQSTVNSEEEGDADDEEEVEDEAEEEEESE